MMGRRHREQASLFHEFWLDDMIPKGHLLRRINDANWYDRPAGGEAAVDAIRGQADVAPVRTIC
jgi:hypothetical protein